MRENAIVEKSFAFSVRIVDLHKYLQQKKGFTISNQIYKSGTSIGANVAEAQRAQSRADFLSKLSIALKEANETQYWLKLLYASKYLSQREFESIHSDLAEILSLLTSICKRVAATKDNNL